MNEIRHNLLFPSDKNEVELCIAVEERFKDLLHTYLRVKHVQLHPPKSLEKEMLLWRTMAVRYKSGDYRHTEDEMMALKTIAQWTVDENCKLRNQPPKKIEWAG